MNYMNFSKASCKNCYKCLRSCPVKAIKFNNQQAYIEEDRCIACGHCLEICPQNAREIISDLQRVKIAIASGKKIVASIAPSFIGYFDLKDEKIIGLLKKMGFTFIEETAIGAKIVIDYYKDYIKNNKLDNYITTACPSVNYLIEKYFPRLIKYMIPVVSPMIAHGKILKEAYGKDSFVVFIGPCVAKKVETDYFKGENVVDAVLTFEEINNWIDELDINIEDIKDEVFDKNALSKYDNFPICRGIIKTMEEELQDAKLDAVDVSGTESCIDIFRSMENGIVKNAFVEVDICKGSCIGGPDMINNDNHYYERLQKVKNYIRGKEEGENICNNSVEFKDINFYRNFRDKTFTEKIPSEEDIKTILNKMGKFNTEDELNCGVCGYNTCREKAQAIFEGMAEEDMCLHYMRSKAESVSNVIFEHTANIVMLMDGDINIVEINPAAEEVFMVKAEDIKGKPACLLIDEDDFKKVRDTGESIIGKRVAYPQYNVVFIENIVYLPKQDIILASMINVMEEEKSKRELMKVREKTLDAAQEVIQKQMRVAQEIAGLLGETTAETKTILNKLRKVVAGEESDM